jgi:hypothetical protein
VDWKTSGATALNVDSESGELTVDALLLSRVAMVVGTVGLVGAARVLPTVLLAVIIGAFVLAGPGSLLLSWYTPLPAYAVLALLPIVGLSFCILIVTLALLLGIYHPTWVLLGLTSATAVGGFARTRYLVGAEDAAI